ncbi:hypothetical protein [Anaerovibrio sp. RM50]|uniref:hypothetical protein n=1 Tax=Anaerovibrio sp. RM50 TaxID=1200557 RepID=UPI000486DBDF|nr:hypothetical protein [Anaerovibrio sp. RM50]
MCTTAAASIAGMGMQLFGGINAAKAQRDYHNANAEYLETMDQVNQQMNENAIDSVQRAAGMQASEARIKGQSMTKSQKAAMASRGVSNSFTYQNILDDSIARSEMDAMAIQYNADVQSQNIRTSGKIQSAQYQAQAAGERAAGKIAYSSGLLSAGTQFANNFLSFSQTSMGRSGGSTTTSTPVATTAGPSSYRFTVPTWAEMTSLRNRGVKGWL